MHNPSTMLRKAELIMAGLFAACSMMAANAQDEKLAAAQAGNPCAYSSFGLAANGQTFWSTPNQSLVIVSQMNCLLDQFAMNNFLYLAGNDAKGKPRFMSLAPWYNLFPVAGAPKWSGNYAPLNGTQLRRFKNEEEAGDSYPLLDVNQQFTSFDIRVNETFFNFVASNTLYKQASFNTALKNFTLNSETGGVWLPPTTQGDPGMGSVEIKTAWRYFGPMQYKYLTQRVKVPVNPCPDSLMHCERDDRGNFWGLVGFHLVQKSVNQPAFIWATFEHVANAPDCNAGASNPISLLPISLVTGKAININQNLPTKIRAQTGWSYFNYTGYKGAGGDGMSCSYPTNRQPNTQCLSDPQGPNNSWLSVNICRTQALPVASAAACANSISDGPNQIAVACLNQSIRANFKNTGLAAKWQNYQLVGLVWAASGATVFGQFTPACFNINQPGGANVCLNYGGMPGGTAPSFGTAGTAALANTTLETWMQYKMNLNGSAKASNCFVCHLASTKSSGQGDMSHIFSRIRQ